MGVLLDEVKLADGDNITYSNVSITNATVSTTDGAAGGLIGYIGRDDETNRDVTYTVTIDNCDLTDVVASGNLSEGHLVGLFSGYDSGETLKINDNCTVTTITTRVDDYISHYTAEQQSYWLEAVDAKYDGLLGDEVYHRGTLYYGDKLFVAKWDGVTTVTPLTEDGKSVIYSAFDMAKLATEASASVKLMSDVDMGGKSIATLKNSITTFDGNSKTIYNVAVSGSSLFASNGAVQSLTIDGATIGTDTTTGNVGVIYSEIRTTGAVGISNLTVKNATLKTTDGNVGGIVGYVGRTTENDRNTSLTATFTNCHGENITGTQDAHVGQLVGQFGGYDMNEKLVFTNCTSKPATGYTSIYRADQQSCWRTAIGATTFDGILGAEKFYRGTIMFGDKQFSPKWDGKTKVVPLTESGAYLIYSPFDLANLQKQNATSVKFKTNVDLGGDYTTAKNEFNPIRTITNLDGEGYTLYNLYVDMVHDGTGAAFIQTSSGTTTHKNLTFDGAYIKNVHNTGIQTPAYGVTNDGGAGNAYAGTLVSHTGGTYTAENVHFKNGTVSAVCKMGGAIGYVGSTNFTMTNCSVDGYIVENYEPGVPNYYTLPSPGYMDIYLQQFQDNWATNAALAAIGIHKIPEYGRVNLLQWWYTNGECGGLIGFVKAQYATIDNCSVTNSEINCIGQPNKPAIANVWDKKDFKTSDPYRSGQAIFAKGSTDIAGRHVNQFIGDVVSARDNENGTNYIVTISDYTVSGNKYKGVNANSTNEYNHKYANNKYCEVVGCAYYVGVDVGLANITLKHVNDYAGELTFYSLGNESNKVTLIEKSGHGNNMDWTGGSFSDMQYGQKNTSNKWYSPNYVYNTFSEYPEHP